MKLVLSFLVVVAVLVSGADGTRAHADMFLSGTNDFIGTIGFYEDPSPWGVFITGSVNHLIPLATLGFHIHSLPIGDNHNCTAGGAHFNPYNVSHGMPKDSVLDRHVGDLGNIAVDADGRATLNGLDWIISLGSNATRSIIDLPLMIHNLTDDGGHTGKGDSNSTGNAGPRIACGTIRLG